MTTSEPRPASTPGTDPTLSHLGGAPGGRTSPPATSSGPGTSPGPGQPARHTGRTIGRTLGLALLLFVTVVLVLFVVFNTQTVDISLVFTDVQAPLVLALLIAAVLGGLVVGLLNAVLGARGRRKNR
ncbi:MAG: hypothetical protein JWQ99_989 [Blastococcus sp.]|nr:hypothetical protein [Blastococcus sp.]